MDFEIYQEIHNKQGDSIRFVNFISPSWILSWGENKDNTGIWRKSDNWKCYGEKVTNIPIEDLKKIEVWDKLSSDIRKFMENGEVAYQEEVKGRMGKARGARKKKYANVPRELICTKCQEKVNVAPGILVARVEKIAKEKAILFTIEDYQKVFQCQRCNCTKGRKANPANANLPKELVCSCGAKVKTNSTALNKVAALRKITIEEYVKNFRCQLCNPTRGKHLRSKRTKKGK
jgi:hypothetical protein